MQDSANPKETPTASTILVYDPPVGLRSKGHLFVASRVGEDDEHYTAVHAQEITQGNRHVLVNNALEHADAYAKTRASVTGEPDGFLNVTDGSGFNTLPFGETMNAITNHPGCIGTINVSLNRRSPFGALKFSRLLTHEELILLGDGYLSKIIGQL